MDEPQGDYQDYGQDNGSMQVRDLEEKQRILKDRLLLIGQNLIDVREKNNEAVLEIKKEITFVF